MNIDRTVAVAALQEIPAGQDRDTRIAALAAKMDEPEAAIRAEVETEQPSVRVELLPWRPFPVDVLPARLASYVQAVASAIGADASIVALAVLVTLAGTIGNRRRVRIKDSWLEPSVLWGAPVARSGRLKSPVLAEVTRPVRRREAEVIAEHGRETEKHEREVAAWSEKEKGQRGEKPRPPDRPTRTLVSDTTVEALAQRLVESPAGLFLFRDELAGWIRGFDAYKSGRGGDAQAFLEMHRAGCIFVDRKTGGTVSVPRAAVSILGGVQPGVLRAALAGEHTEDGLAARFLFAMPPERPKVWTDADLAPAIRDDWAALLDEIGMLPYDGTPVDLPLTPEARAAFVEFYDEHAHREAEAETDALAAAFSKLEGAAARLALVLALACDTRATVVDYEAMVSGIELARWFAHEAERLYQTFHETPADRERRVLIEWIAARGGSTTARDLARGPSRYRGQGGMSKALLDLKGLVAAGFGTWELRAPSSAGGRPVEVFRLGDSSDGDTTSDDPHAGGGDGTPRDLNENAAFACDRTGDGTPDPREVPSPSPLSPGAKSARDKPLGVPDAEWVADI